MLNTPIYVKNLKIKNRLVMPPMATSNGDNGKIMPKHYEYYQEKSVGGYIGLIITEHSYISKEGKASNNQVSIAYDEDIEGMKKLVDIIHNNDTVVFAQISHAGSKTVGDTKLSASAVRPPNVKEGVPLPKAMDTGDINKVIDDFVSAALRVKQAGFDGVEIHGAHGYLLNQFYSPLTNQRQDRYGGNLSSRIQILLDVIKAVRASVGKEYPIALRLGACDYIDGGNVESDAVEAAIAFEQAGIDVLDISGGMNGYIRPGRDEEGYFSDIASLIKQNVSIPVIVTGGVKTANGLKEVLQSNSADMVGVGRAIFKDSSWAKNCMESIEE